ncbi:hypothetical protein UPYG_G00323720 [Umbra pygmaea]|uniref:Fatty acid hydroxylase domain-containing protein n=1 Tax=Umbra pygmaea TaxID=75934 RepID=A0ABD0W0Z9_UMBPY
MDLVLNVADHYVFTPYVYPSSWPEDSPLRQIISLLVVTNLGVVVLYLGLGWLSYQFIFDRHLMKHTLFLKNQVWKEIELSMTALPMMSIPTVAIFFLEIRGHSQLYDNIDESLMGWAFVIFSMISFLLFTDGCIYWIHRSFHHKLIYKHFHKLHHVFKVVYLALYIFVNMWTVSIHDGNYCVPGPLQGLVNGAAHHTDHHRFFTVNYGQYFTLWDRIGGSYHEPLIAQRKEPPRLHS